MKLFGKELTLEQTIGFIRCQSPELTGDCKECLMVQAAKDLITEVERLTAESAYKDGKILALENLKEKKEQQIATMKKALELMHDHLAEMTNAEISSVDDYIEIVKAQEMEAEK